LSNTLPGAFDLSRRIIAKMTAASPMTAAAIETVLAMSWRVLVGDLIVSPSAALEMAARNAPGPLCAVLETVEARAHKLSTLPASRKASIAGPRIHVPECDVESMGAFSIRLNSDLPVFRH
jgi:hypothetical protein